MQCNSGEGEAMIAKVETDRLQRGQAPLPDLFYSQLRKTSNELESRNKTSQEEGLAPAG